MCIYLFLAIFLLFCIYSITYFFNVLLEAFLYFIMFSACLSDPFLFLIDQLQRLLGVEK